MARIYKTSDRVKIKVDGLVVHISPLTYQVKSEMQSLIIAGKPMDAAVLSFKNAIKKIEGLTDQNDDEYKVEFENGVLTDGCVDDLMNIQQGTKLNLISIALLNGLPEEFENPNTGLALEGVSYVEASKKGKKSKAKVGA